MSEPILEQRYWAERLEGAKKRNLHEAVFRCPVETWIRIEERHRKLLADRIGSVDSVIDCGCGWGRLLDMMPTGWRGRYLGIDLSPDFIAMARELHPSKDFLRGDLLHLFPFSEQWSSGTIKDAVYVEDKYQWAILISIRPMVRRNLGEEVWEVMEQNIHKVANKLLYLEYDPSDSGSVE